MTPQIQSATLCDPKLFCLFESHVIKEKKKKLRKKRKDFSLGLEANCWGFRHATTPLESSVYGEWSEGATIQLTTCGVCPKLSESQCVPPQSYMHKPRGPCCAAASERPPCHHSPSLGHSVLSAVLCVCMYLCVWTVCSCVYMCIHLCSSIYLGMCAYTIFIKTFVCLCLPARAGQACGLWSACQTARFANRGGWYSAIDHLN